MKRNFIVLIFITILMFGLAFLKPVVRAQTNRSNQPDQNGRSGATGEKTAGETYKNIQVLTDLKDGSTADFIGAMQFISGSLSVDCNYCHAGPFSNYSSDEKETKRIARNMIKMTRAINENNFGGALVVTCNTCHQGSTHPKATPTPWYKTPEQIAAYVKAGESSRKTNNAAEQPVTPSKSEPSLPEPSEVISNFRKATGADGLISVRMSGTKQVVAFGAPNPWEMDVLLPDKAAIRQTIQGTKAGQIVNRDRGWVFRGSWTALPPRQSAGILRDLVAALLPTAFIKSDSEQKVTGIEKIGDRSYYVVKSNGNKRLYFDVQSGLLYKVRSEFPTKLGTRVEETTFEDYRKSNGMNLPYLIISHYMEDQFTYKISKIDVNIDLDEAKFEPTSPN
ncbi:MAG TPA: c-type cytochrome [Blastocatellia bacterium]|nr:c-type cytochrome [Blastocatellia bacterium]